MLPEPATGSSKGGLLSGSLGGTASSALASLPFVKRGRNAHASHRQYEAQRNAWERDGRGWQANGSIADGSWRGMVASGAPARATATFVITCLLWYLTSAFSSNTSKALVSSPKVKHAVQHLPLEPVQHAAASATTLRTPPPFPYPVTLTLIQFVFIHLLSSAVASSAIMTRIPGVRQPVTRIVAKPGWKRISDMAKLSVFNVVGHALSTVAISRVPVSTVHTIKALTPLFTVMSFRFIFDVRYSPLTYVSLLPLTLGVMMACTSLSFSANDLLGLSTALASTFIFVAQSIYSKNLVGKGGESKGTGNKDKGDGTTSEGKLDKINILYYTSACSVVIMIPMALYYDAPKLFGALAVQRKAALATAVAAGGATLPASTAWTAWLILANGLSQFAQNFLAFSVLSLVSPVTYSIASLFKRVFVICFAIVWFGQSVSMLQWCGIVLTFVGLYMYNDAKTSKSASAKEAALERRDSRDLRLPTTVQNTNTSLFSTSSLINPSGPATPIPEHSPKASRTGFSPHQQQMPLAPHFAQHLSLNLHGDQQHDAMANMHSMANTHSKASSLVPRYAADPRQSIPSPPPSRGPSSEDGSLAPNSPRARLLVPR